MSVLTWPQMSSLLLCLRGYKSMSQLMSRPSTPVFQFRLVLTAASYSDGNSSSSSQATSFGSLQEELAL